MFAALLGFRERVLWPRIPIGKRLKEARQIGRDAEWLVAQDWRELLPMQFEEVSKRMKIGEPVVYHKYAALIQAKEKARFENTKLRSVLRSRRENGMFGRSFETGVPFILRAPKAASRRTKGMLSPG